MSIWTCKAALTRIAGLILISATLAACASNPAVSRRGGSFGFLSGAQEKVTVANKSVVIAGPAGYCVQSSATRNLESGAFVLLGSCAAIANDSRIPAPKVPAMLTASVSGASRVAVGQSLGGMQAFFRSEVGRATLARDGQAASVTILETRRRSDAFYIHLRDTSENIAPSLAQEYWRGLFDVRGRIVTVSVHGFLDRPLNNGLGLATLESFAARIRRENPTKVVVQNG